MMEEEGIVRLQLSREQSRALHILGANETSRPKYKHITRVIYGGQAGGGKSFLICLWLNYMATTFEGTRYYMAREHLKDIKESVLLTFWDVLHRTGTSVKYNENKALITYPNGSQIYLVDCFAYPADPDFNSLGSREYTAGAIEEGITVTERAADILISRTRYKHTQFALTPKQLITCNPGEGWIKDKIVMPTLDGLPMPPNEMFIRATLQSNPDVSFREAYEKTLTENMGEYDLARLRDGDWNARIKTGAEYLKEFNQQKHVREVKYNPLEAIHMTFDENVYPYITCQLWQIHRAGDKRYARQFDEICQAPPNNTREKVCNAFKARYPLGTHRGGVFVYGDATSFKSTTDKEVGENFFTDILSYIAEYNPVLRVPKANPPVMTKGKFIDAILSKNYRGIIIEIAKHCKFAISDYSFTLEDSDGGILKKRVTDPETKISFEKNGHHVDAMTYFFCYAFLEDFYFYLGGSTEGAYEVGTDHKNKFNR